LISAAYKRYLLSILLIIQAFSWMDGMAIGLASQDIKAELQLSDTQLGMLTGIAFALFYAAMGIPIARWADRSNRGLIISLSATAWSVMVALCGLAHDFWQLVLIRVGVAIGQAGCVPPAHSLIADYFPRAERPRATAIYMLGGPASALVGYVSAGWLIEVVGWRVMFAVLGAAGLVPAVVAWFTIRDPYRGNGAPTDVSRDVPGTREICRSLWRIRTFRHLLVTFALVNLFSYGMNQWMATFYIRTYGLTTAQVGSWFALIWGGGGLVGTYVGGAWAARFATNDERRQLNLTGLAYTVFGAVSALMYLSTNVYVSLALMTVASLGLGTVSGPMFATIQTLVPSRIRATAIAILYLFANLVGMGLGPLAVGALSDWLQASSGGDSLRYALLGLCPGYVWCAIHLWRAAATVMEDLEWSR